MRVEAGDVRLYFEVVGRESELDGVGLRRRPTVVALHGGPGLDGAKLRHTLGPLAEVAQVIVPDQRGHGRSDLGEPETWNLGQWARDVVAFCDALEIERPIVLGVSFGGFVAQRYAAEHPGHPAGLILVSTGPRFLAEDEIVSRFRELGGPEAAAAMRRDLDEATEESGAEWERVCSPLMRVRPDPRHELLESIRLRTMEVNLHFHREEARSLDLRPGLGNVRCPALVLVGERDPLVPVSLTQEIVDAMPPGLGRLVVVPEASHEVAADNPDFVFGAVLDFVPRLATNVTNGRA